MNCIKASHCYEVAFRPQEAASHMRLQKFMGVPMLERAVHRRIPFPCRKYEKWILDFFWFNSLWPHYFPFMTAEKSSAQCFFCTALIGLVRSGFFRGSYLQNSGIRRVFFYFKHTCWSCLFRHPNAFPRHHLSHTHTHTHTHTPKVEKGWAVIEVKCTKAGGTIHQWCIYPDEVLVVQRLRFLLAFPLARVPLSDQFRSWFAAY